MLRNYFIRARVKLIETAIERSGEAADSMNTAAKIIVEAKEIKEAAKKVRIQVETSFAEKERMEEGSKLAWLGVGPSVTVLLIAVGCIL